VHDSSGHTAKTLCAKAYLARVTSRRFPVPTPQVFIYDVAELCRCLDSERDHYVDDANTVSMVRMIDSVSLSGMSGLSDRPPRTQRATSAAS
jgi:hypothetical protein